MAWQSDPYKGLPLFRAHARRGDPSTSKIAAASMHGDNVSRCESLVLECIRKAGPVSVDGDEVHGGATWDEVEAATGVPGKTVSPRFKPLRRKGLIRSSGHKRPGRSGRGQIVWEACPAEAGPTEIKQC